MKLSIITVNLNNADGLRKTIDSVINQTYTHFEHIIIDGGSTDGSVEVIKEYETLYKEKQRHLYWVSEPDKGIYNGMNKGIKVAKGEYCLFLNSGDWLIEDILIKVFQLKLKNSIIYFNILSNKGVTKYPSKIDLLFFFHSTIHHQATFIKRKLFIHGNLYNEQRTIISDIEFWLENIIIKEVDYIYVPIVLTYFDLNGISSSQISLVEKERKELFFDLFNLKSEYFKETFSQLNEMKFYKNSKAIRFFTSIQKSKLYKYLRRINS